MANPSQVDYRNIYHPHNTEKTENTHYVAVPVTDDEYKERFDYELLDAVSTRYKLMRAYKITCIPFITYGINKGDIVSVAKDGTINKLLADSGQYGYRIAYPVFTSDEDTHVHIDAVLRQFRESGYDTEEFNHKVSALSVNSQAEAIKLEALLRNLVAEQRILEFETIR